MEVRHNFLSAEARCKPNPFPHYLEYRLINVLLDWLRAWPILRQCTSRSQGLEFLETAAATRLSLHGENYHFLTPCFYIYIYTFIVNSKGVPFFSEKQV